MKRILPLLLVIAGLLAGPARAGAAPDVLVRTSTNNILALLKANKDAYAKDKKKLYAAVDEVVLPNFDFRAMSKLVLAQAWREATEDQRGRFTGEFRDLLVRTYSTALLKYTNEEVIFLPYKGANDDNTAVVKTEIKLGGGGANVPIDYAFFQKDGGWKVYDVKIDGISLVTNYRSTYAEKVRSQGLDALIAGLANDNKSGKVDQALTGKSKK
jgi:phospholipid transport system substrate-binding protein